MFRKLLKSLSGKSDPILPQQGKRLDLNNPNNDEVAFTIRGQGHPGFFIFFGAFFGGIPALMFILILTGSATAESEGAGTLFVLLFMVPFILIGGATFLAGLFLWFGRTLVQVGPSTVRAERSLFGKTFQQKQFDRSRLNLSFEESHRSNNVPHYKLKLDDGAQKIGVGGSLKEAELLWLNQELRTTLGETPREVSSVVESMAQDDLEDLDNSEIEPNYQSAKLQISPTVTGWEARTRTSIPGCLGMALFGSIFLVVGLMMWTPSRDFFFDLFPGIRDAVSDMESSGSPPTWFAMTFGGAGLVIILLAFFLLGYRSTYALRHSRFFVHRRWLIFSRTCFIDIHDIKELETGSNGHVNNVPRYHLKAHLKNGDTFRIVTFATRQDVGQLKARLRKVMK
ncbi:MAG: hypothetical protein ACON4R_13710 [Akkermansiaceae bacterium]